MKVVKLLNCSGTLEICANSKDKEAIEGIYGQQLKWDTVNWENDIDVLAKVPYNESNMAKVSHGLYKEGFDLVDIGTSSSSPSVTFAKKLSEEECEEGKDCGSSEETGGEESQGNENESGEETEESGGDTTHDHTITTGGEHSHGAEHYHGSSTGQGTDETSVDPEIEKNEKSSE